MADRIVDTRKSNKKKKKRTLSERINFSGKNKASAHKKNIKKNISKLSKFLGF